MPTGTALTDDDVLGDEVGATALAGLDGAGHPYRRVLVAFVERRRERILGSGIAGRRP